MTVLGSAEWKARMAQHHARADQLLDRFRHPGSYHPVYDFLFEYYPVRPSHLRRWHPGQGTLLEGPAPHSEWRDYTSSGNLVGLDALGWWARRGESACTMRTLMRKTTTNPTSFDCFGLHEWAMVYKTDNPRHDLPLRLGPEGTNAVVESSRIKCTHYDAYRFFTTPAIPLNLTVLARQTQPLTEQAACVHATMDIYKWAWKLGPIVPGELFLDSLELAVAARTLDMEASPYDCTGWGFGVVPIETPEGKAEYVRRQRDLAARAKPLRQRLVALIDEVEAATLAHQA